MNRYIKNLIVDINDFCKKFVLPSSNMDNLFMLKNLQNQLIQSIDIAKQKYFNKISKNSCDPMTSTKCYWSLLKTILNGKKVPCIPPIFHNNKYVKYSHAIFHKKLLAFIRPLGNYTYGIYNPLGIRLLNRLCLGFSHLREHKFRHNFADTLNPLCSCSLETERYRTLLSTLPK